MNFNFFHDRGILRGIGYGFVLVGLLCQVELIIFVSLDRAIRNNTESTQLEKLQRMENIVTDELEHVLVDLSYLVSDHDALRYLEEKSGESLLDLHSSMEMMMKSRFQYDQIRIFDLKGFEQARLNLNEENQVYIVPEDQLQDKSKRYYFLEAKNLTSGETYISPFDLNVEHGEVEVPHKPMIRFSRNIYNKRGQWIGVGMINFQGAEMLQLIVPEEDSEESRFYLLNEDGYYLKGDSREKEWGFMFPQRMEIGFFRDFPQEWEQIKNSDQTRILNPHGLFLSIKMDPQIGESENKNSWYLIFYEELSVYHRTDQFLALGILFGAILLGPLLMWVGIRLGISSYREEVYLRKIESMALNDSLTGLLNRRAIYEEISHLMMSGTLERGKLSMGFIDVDNLKYVNDTEGHDAGDLLITKAAESVKKVVRETDLTARIGGDEFLIAFPGCDRNTAMTILKRADDVFRREGKKYTGKEWTLSYGASEYQGESDNIDEMIQRADKEMYLYKAKHKKNREAFN